MEYQATSEKFTNYKITKDEKIIGELHYKTGLHVDNDGYGDVNLDFVLATYNQKDIVVYFSH